MVKHGTDSYTHALIQAKNALLTASNTIAIAIQHIENIEALSQAQSINEVRTDIDDLYQEHATKD